MVNNNISGKRISRILSNGTYGAFGQYTSNGSVKITELYYHCDDVFRAIDIFDNDTFYNIDEIMKYNLLTDDNLNKLHQFMRLLKINRLRGGIDNDYENKNIL
jgi:hypothetical protein